MFKVKFQASSLLLKGDAPCTSATGLQSIWKWVKPSWLQSYWLNPRRSTFARSEISGHKNAPFRYIFLSHKRHGTCVSP